MESYKVVLTGGPVSGKTTILNELKKVKKGACFVDEVARDLLKAAKNTGTRAVPWDGFFTFELRNMRIQLQRENKCSGLTFIDRSAIDGIAYYKLLGGKPPRFLIDLARRRKYNKVFFMELLPFEKDSERYESSQEEAKRISDFIEKTYVHFGYNPIKVPLMSVKKRLGFILEKL